MMALFSAIDRWFWEGMDLRRTVASRWASPQTARNASSLLFAYRFIAFSFLFGIEVWEWCCKEYNGGVYISYLTYQGQWYTIIYFFFALLSHGIYFAGRHPSPQIATAATPTWTEFAIKQVQRATQTMFDIAVPLELLIVVLYWSMIFSGSWASDELKFRDLVQHIVTFLLLWMDLALGAMRLPDRHVIIPLSVGIIYLFWNLGFTKVNYPLYSVLKWIDYWSAIIAIAALIGIVLFFFVGSTFGWLLTKCAKKYPTDVLSKDPKNIGELAPFTVRFLDEPAAFPCHTSRCCNKQGELEAERIVISPTKATATAAVPI